MTYLIMEFCNGGDFRTYLEDRKSLDETVIRQFFRQSVSGLKFLHDQKIIHRDLKPSNILLSFNGNRYPAPEEINLKIADFGSARFLLPEEEPSVGSFTLLYLAPERRDFKSYDEKADLWSIGIMIRECLVGCPYSANSQLPTKASKEIRGLLKKLLAIKPQDRPSCEQILAHKFMNKRQKSGILSLWLPDLPISRTLSLGGPASRKNIYDENMDFDTAKRILTNLKLDDEPEYDEDVINWDETPACEEPKSADFRPPLTQSNRSFSTQSNAVTSEAGCSAKRDSSYASYSFNSQTIDGIISSEKRPLSITDISKKLQAENRVLRRYLEAAKEEQILTPHEAIVKMLTGQTFTLKKFKSRDDKTRLLDEAISTGDGDSIITTLLYIRDSTKQTIFNLELRRRPVAIEHYILFLKQQTETDFFNQLIDLLGMLGRNEEAAMLKYKQAAKYLSHDSKKKALKNCLSSHFQTDPSLSFESTLISDQLSLIESQLPVDSNDTVLAEKRLLAFKDGHRMPLLDTPVISTLLYSCVYHYEETENHLGSPIAIRNKHGLSDKQYLWTVIKGRGKLRQWHEIEKLFEIQGWLGGTKMKSMVGFDRVISLLKDLRAPRYVLDKYCNLVEGADRRLEVGLKYGCCGSVIETYKYLRDRQKLLIYETTLEPNSPEQFHATCVLKDQTIKWKN